MDQQDIKTFLAIVNNQSFSKTAKLLYTTQTTVSHRIATMEKELGYSLLDRRQGLRTVALTPLGAQFVSLAEQWDALWESSQAIRDANFRRRLHIGATNRLITHILPPFFCRFMQEEASIIPDLQSYHSEEIVDMVERKELDIGFISKELHRKNLNVVPFLKEPIVMVCHAGSYYSHKLLHPEELDVKNEVRLSFNMEIQNWHDKWWSRNRQPYVYVDAATVAGRLLTERPLWALYPYSVALSMQERFPLDIHEFSVEVPYQMSYVVRHQAPHASKTDILQTLLTCFIRYGQTMDGFLLTPESELLFAEGK